jgi:hypothetical protein
MTKHCLDDTFYVQGVPVSTSAATVATGEFANCRVATYADFASRRREALGTFDTDDERRAFERLSKADQCAALGVVLNTSLHDGDVLSVPRAGPSIQLTVDTKAMSGRRGRRAFDPDAYVATSDPTHTRYYAAQRQARAAYASLALAHLDATTDVHESRAYSEKVVSAFLLNADTHQLVAAFLTTDLSDLMWRDGYNEGAGTVDMLVDSLEIANPAQYARYAASVAHKDIDTVGRALQFVAVARLGRTSLSDERYLAQLQSACAVLALESANRLDAPKTWARREVTRLTELLSARAQAGLSKGTTPETSYTALYRASTERDLFATRPLEAQHARAARERREEIERTLMALSSNRAVMEEFAIYMFARPIVTADDALIFATFCHANPWRPEGMSFMDTDPQYEHALRLLSATNTIETAPAVTYLRSELHASQPDEEMFFPPKDPFAPAEARLAAEMQRPPTTPDVVTTSVTGSGTSSLAYTTAPNNLFVPAEARLAAALAQERFEAARQAHDTITDEPEVVPSSEPHAAILNAYPDTRHLQQTTSPLRERERAAYDKYEAAHLALEFASLRGENEPGEVVQAQKAQIALWQEWQDLFVALSNERSTARQN